MEPPRDDGVIAEFRGHWVINVLLTLSIRARFVPLCAWAEQNVIRDKERFV